LQPFTNPVCTAEGTIFELTHILPWIKKHGTDPTTGQALTPDGLIKLNFKKNEEDKYVDPVTFKVLTDNTHIVALKPTGNVFSYDTVERLNIKAKMWRDLVSDQEFSKKDIIVLQDPQNIDSRNLSNFKYLQDGTSTLTEDQIKERNDPTRNVNTSALGNGARVLEKPPTSSSASSPSTTIASRKAPNPSNPAKSVLTPAHTSKPQPRNAAIHTTGQAAASFTSTGMTPHTSSSLALLSAEDYLLRPRRIKSSGFARITTNHGSLTLELLPEFAPKAVWNFITLAKKGYYNGVVFHRNIRSFMIQGGDPTGTGRGGESCWGKEKGAGFKDEFDGPLNHDARGVVSMANKGKDTNQSQFFITYRPAAHLDRKHTIFGKVVEGMDTLNRLENVPVTEKEKRPLEEVIMEEVSILVDPFEEFQKNESEKERAQQEKEEIKRAGGTEDDRTTWTGKRLRADGTVVVGGDAGGVGKYLKAAKKETAAPNLLGEEIVEEWEQEAEPVKKKVKTGGFGNFDSW
jgi:peptidyl-prolyl cis-trans isomerase-like protein 2